MFHGLMNNPVYIPPALQGSLSCSARLSQKISIFLPKHH